MLKIKKNHIYFIWCIILMVVNILFLSDKMPNVNKFNFDSNTYNILLFTSLIFEIIFCILIYILNNKNIKIQNIFLVIMIPLGILFMILIPPGQTPDEHVHYARTYEISEGNLISSKKCRNMPKEVYSSFIERQSDGNYEKLLSNVTKKNSDKENCYYFPSAAVYNFICYMPQTIGVTIGKLFNLPILVDAYLGRLFNLLCFVLLMYLSIKYIPFYKEVLVLISLLPITLQEAISLSPDALTIGIIVFLVSYVLHLTYNKDTVSNKDYLLLSILCIITSLCKIVYIPVCLILFIIPKQKFKSLKDKNIRIFALAFLVIIINLLWLKTASGFLVQTREDVYPEKQIEFILSHPINYLITFFKSIRFHRKFYLFTMLGQHLELLNINVTKFYPILSIIFMIILIIIERMRNSIIKNSTKLLIFLISFIITFLILTSLYIQWTPVKRTIIEGVQGRYFLPILFFVPMLFMRTKKNEKIYKFDKINMYIFVLGVFANICALMFIFSVN